MFTFITLWVIIGLIFFIISRLEDDSWGVTISSSVFGGLILSAILTLFISMLWTEAIGDEHYQKTTKVEHLSVFKDGNSVSGSFFLGCGTINGSMKYTYYAQYEDGGFELRSVYPSGYRIYETDSTEQPRIERYDWEYVEGSWKWENWVWCTRLTSPSRELTKQKDKIFVPFGTIKEEFVLDAQ